jgi:Flp pilus assembly protein CpaB
VARHPLGPRGRRRRRPVVLPHVPVRRWVRRARRSPTAWWSAAAAVAVLAATRLSAIDDEAEARRAAWGEAVTVAVAARDLAAGDVIGPGDVVVDEWPRAMVPDRAVEEPPIGRTVAAPIVVGEAVVSDRVAPEGLSDVAALLPPGWRAVAVPSASGGFGADAPPLALGDRVDVLATFEVLDVDSPPTETVAEGALVVDVGETNVTVAVPAADAERVANAATTGTVTLTLAGAE